MLLKVIGMAERFMLLKVIGMAARFKLLKVIGMAARAGMIFAALSLAKTSPHRRPD
jgi:fructose-specific component phosphotransferase system IIB-like protein